MSLFQFDSIKRTEYGPIVCGLDESGRGAWAGDIYGGAVIFEEGVFIEGLNDSKQLSETKRDRLFDEIYGKALYVGVGICTVDEINKHGLTWANVTCLQRAALEYDGKIDYYIIDQGPKNPLKPQSMFPKADSISASVAAASIIAKVSRDKTMKKIADLYPEYGFDKHFGYVNDLHTSKVKQLGLIDGLYRIQYRIKALDGKQVSIFNVKG